jgi:protease inhibitor Inh
MSGFDRMAFWGKNGAKAAAALLVLAALTACASAPKPEPPPVAAAPPPSPSPPTPPPIDLAGRWRLTAAAGGACFMTFGDAPGAAQGSIAPEGGCPGNFFTSRKWTFEHDALIIRDHKSQPLAQLSFTGGHFEGQDSNGGTLSLSH